MCEISLRTGTGCSEDWLTHRREKEHSDNAWHRKKNNPSQECDHTQTLLHHVPTDESYVFSLSVSLSPSLSLHLPLSPWIFNILECSIDLRCCYLWNHASDGTGLDSFPLMIKNRKGSCVQRWSSGFFGGLEALIVWMGSMAVFATGGWETASVRVRAQIRMEMNSVRRHLSLAQSSVWLFTKYDVGQLQQLIKPHYQPH